MEGPRSAAGTDGGPVQSDGICIWNVNFVSVSVSVPIRLRICVRVPFMSVLVRFRMSYSVRSFFLCTCPSLSYGALYVLVRDNLPCHASVATWVATRCPSRAGSAQNGDIELKSSSGHPAAGPLSVHREGEGARRDSGAFAQTRNRAAVRAIGGCLG